MTIQHQSYSIAYLNKEGQPKINTMWLPVEDLATKRGVMAIKSALLYQYLEAARLTQAELLDCLRSSEITEAAKSPQADSVLNRDIQRWDVMQGESKALDNEPTYELSIKESNGQVYVDVTPAGDQLPEQIVNLPQLSIFVEINEGLPCAHIFSEVHGETVISIFGDSRGKLIVRPGDADRNTIRTRSAYQPTLAQVADEMVEIRAENLALSEPARETSS